MSASTDEVMISVLGPVQVAGRTLTTGATANALLALISQTPNACHADYLCAQLWAEPGRRGALRKQVAHLNTQMATNAVPLEIRLSGAECWLSGTWQRDCELFLTGVNHAESLLPQQPDRAHALLQQALGLWRGLPFTGARPASALTERSTTLQQQYRRAHAVVAHSDLRAGRPHEAVRRLRVLGTDQPGPGQPGGDYIGRLLHEALRAAGRHVEAAAAPPPEPLAAMTTNQPPPAQEGNAR